MEISPVTRHEHFLARAAGDNNALELQPVTREEHFLQNIIDAIEEGGGGGGGGSVTPASIVSATGEMTAQQAADTLGNIGGEPEKLIVNVTYSGGVYSADKTFSEIVAANAAKADIVVIHSNKKFHPFYVDSSYASFVFLENYTNDKAIKIQQLRVTSSGWTLYETFSAVLPWSDEDSGKSPVVDGNGHYSLVKLEVAPTTVTDLESSSITLSSAADNTIYECGELTSLTISSFDNPGKFWIWFTSGATATVVTGIDNFTPEANKKYRVFVENGYATFDAWSVGGGS